MPLGRGVVDREIALELDAGGFPVVARTAALVRASPARVWRVVADVEGYAGRVPLIERVTRVAASAGGFTPPERALGVSGAEPPT